MVAVAVAGVQSPQILDCGCGTGNNLALLRRHGTPAGIDLTWTGLRFARDRGERALAQASAAHMPFGEGTFDLVNSFDLIYALDDDVERAAMAEVFRVLRPGGQLIVNAAAMEMLRGNHSVLAGEVRRYSRRSLRARL